MAVTINASTTSGLVMTSDLSGNLQLQWNGQAAPAFSAYQSSAQTIANATATKITFTTEEFDTNNNFASSRFTPTVAGYYQINTSVCLSPTVIANGAYAIIYKNGLEYKAGNFGGIISGFGLAVTIASLVYCNGSTDYVEIYVFQNTTANAASLANAAFTYFNGSLVRGA
jgi:hypothetical protein